MNHDAIHVLDLCNALVGVRPGLAKWRDALSVAADPWVEASETECLGLLHFLSLDADGRDSLEETLRDLRSAVVRRAAAVSFDNSGGQRPLLDVALLFTAARSHARTLRFRRQLRVLGQPRDGRATFSTLAFDTVLLALRDTHSVFPTRDDVVQRLAATDNAVVADVDALMSDDDVAPAGAQDVTTDVDVNKNEEEADDAAVATGDEEEADDDGGAAADDGVDAAIRENNAEEPEEPEERDEVAALLENLVPPEVLDARLVNPRLVLQAGYRVADLQRWSSGRRSTLFAHGTLPDIARFVRRAGLHDPVLRGWGRSGVPPGCAALYMAPVLNQLSIAFCASFAVYKSVMHTGKEPATVEVVLFKADEAYVYGEEHALAGRYRWGAQTSNLDSPAWGVLNAVQMRGGRSVNWCVLNGMQVVRLMGLHPVVVECGIDEAMFGEVLSGSESLYDDHGRMLHFEPVGSLVFDVLQ